jgi:hypothetical protein
VQIATEVLIEDEALETGIEMSLVRAMRFWNEK